jgi:HK97 gp10 family phage protein
MATSRVTLTLEGFEETRRAVVAVPDAARAMLSDVIAKTTFATGQRAKALAPRETGLLRSSITAVSRGLYGRVTVSGDAFYWRFVEYGTVKMAAKPFVRPSVEMEQPQFLERVRNVGRELERDWTSGGGLL